MPLGFIAMAVEKAVGAMVSKVQGIAELAESKAKFASDAGHLQKKVEDLLKVSEKRCLTSDLAEKLWTLENFEQFLFKLQITAKA